VPSARTSSADSSFYLPWIDWAYPAVTLQSNRTSVDAAPIATPNAQRRIPSCVAGYWRSQ
jgi:hypothetical protein